MDPNATLAEISTALRTGDMSLAAILREDLLSWIAQGGFQPQWQRYPSAARFCIFAPTKHVHLAGQ